MSTIDDAIDNPTMDSCVLATLQGVAFVVRVIQQFQKETISVRMYADGPSPVVPFTHAVLSYKRTEFTTVYRNALLLATDIVIEDR